MTGLGVWIVLLVGFVAIERITSVGVGVGVGVPPGPGPELQLGSMEAQPFPERPVLFTSPSDVKNYLDSLGKKISFSARQRYGKRAKLQAFRVGNQDAARLQSPSANTREECNCERLRK